MSDPFKITHFGRSTRVRQHILESPCGISNIEDLPRSGEDDGCGSKEPSCGVVEKICLLRTSKNKKIQKSSWVPKLQKESAQCNNQNFPRDVFFNINGDHVKIYRGEKNKTKDGKMQDNTKTNGLDEMGNWIIG